MSYHTEAMYLCVPFKGEGPSSACSVGVTELDSTMSIAGIFIVICDLVGVVSSAMF